MRSKLVLLLFLLVLVGLPAMAQKKKKADYPVDPRGLMVEVSGGINTKVDETGMGNIGPVFNLSLAKMFGVHVGMRFGMTLASNTSKEGDTSWVLGEGKYSQKNISLDFVWDILNTINPDLFFIPFKVYPFIRGNFYLLNNGPLSEGHYAFEMGIGGGLKLAYSFSERWGVFADAAGVAVSAQALRGSDATGVVVFPTASLGLFVNFGF